MAAYMLSLKEIREKYQIPYQEQRCVKKPYNALATSIIKFLLNTNVTANQVTTAMVLIGSLSCLLLIFGNYWITLLAFALFHFHIVLDSVDGPIARIKNFKSSKGLYIERIGHDLIFALFFFCIALGCLNKGFSSTAILVLGFTSSFGHFFYKHTRKSKIFSVLLQHYKEQKENTKSQDKLRDESSVNKNSPKTKKSFLRNLYKKLQFLWDYPVVIIFTLLALFDLLYLGLFFYGLTYPILFLLSFIQQANMSESRIYEWLEKH